jgi:hypothetical protein
MDQSLPGAPAQKNLTAEATRLTLFGPSGPFVGFDAIKSGTLPGLSVPD